MNRSKIDKLDEKCFIFSFSLPDSYLVHSDCFGAYSLTFSFIAILSAGFCFTSTVWSGMREERCSTATEVRFYY